jgi:hypothetical protein
MANKVKVFRFLVSDYGYMASEDFNKRTQHQFKNVCNEEDIEECINEFLDYNGELVDLKVNTVTVANHNNGGCNKVELIYTLTYKTN